MDENEITLSQKDVDLLIFALSVYHCEVHNFIICCRDNPVFADTEKRNRAILQSIEKLRDELTRL